MDKKCICCHAEELSSVEIAYIESIHCAVGLYLERDEIENYLLNVYSSDGTEFKVKINYCPMCGRKLTEE